MVFGLFALLAVNAVYLSSDHGPRVGDGARLPELVLPIHVPGPPRARRGDRGAGRGVRRRSTSETPATVPTAGRCASATRCSATSLVLLVSGIVLTRLEGVVRGPRSERAQRRLLGARRRRRSRSLALRPPPPRRPAIKWKVGGAWASVAAGFAVLMVAFQSQDPRQWNVVGPDSGEKYFFPSLARTATGNFIPARALMDDDYCKSATPTSTSGWAHSVHRFSSFNNPAYLFSVRETRKVSLERDGNVQASRWCAGCHDPVPFFSGAFDDPNFDDVNHPTAQAGITCTVCHAITHVNSTRGNADYTIEEPVALPVRLQRQPGAAVGQQPARQGQARVPQEDVPQAVPQDGRVLLHLPQGAPAGGAEPLQVPPRPEPLRHVPAVAASPGHGVQSFYYPPKAKPNCNGCHMPLQASRRLRREVLRRLDGSSRSTTTCSRPRTRRSRSCSSMPDVGDRRASQKFLEGVMRVDLFGVREGGDDRRRADRAAAARGADAGARQERTCSKR